MASPIVFALTKAQAVLLDAITRPGFKPYRYYRELSSLRHRYLVQEVKGGHRLTAPGTVAQELVRTLRLHTGDAGEA
jgi:hypothetical protein